MVDQIKSKKGRTIAATKSKGRSEVQGKSSGRRQNIGKPLLKVSDPPIPVRKKRKRKSQRKLED